MRDCDDGSRDDPEGSLERLIGEFEATAQAFRDEAASNMEQRRAADPPGAEFEGLYGDREFVAEPYLLVQHDPQEVKRPLGRRPDVVPPLRSAAIEVQDSTGSAVDAVGSNETYGVEVTLRNLGGVAARSTTVELYAEHRPLDATMDTSPDSETVELYRNPGDRADDQLPYSGFSTIRPGGEVTFVAYIDRGDGLEDDSYNMFHKIIDVPVGPGRVFSTTPPGKPASYLHTSESIPDDRDDFKLQVYETSEIEKSYLQVGGPVFVTRLREDVPFVAEFDGTFTTDPAVEPEQLDLTSSEDASETALVGSKRTSVSANGTGSVSFEYSPSAPPADETRSLTVFYVRAYDIATAEAPENWSALDHVSSRFMGRSEVAWSGS